jgi:hypothetical protein
MGHTPNQQLERGVGIAEASVPWLSWRFTELKRDIVINGAVST